MSNKEKVIHITIPKDYKPKKVNGKKCTGLFPIYDEVCDPRIDSPEYVKMILELWEQAKPKRSIGSHLRNGNIIVYGMPN